MLSNPSWCVSLLPCLAGPRGEIETAISTQEWPCFPQGPPLHHTNTLQPRQPTPDLCHSTRATHAHTQAWANKALAWREAFVRKIWCEMMHSTFLLNFERTEEEQVLWHEQWWPPWLNTKSKTWQLTVEILHRQKIHQEKKKWGKKPPPLYTKDDKQNYRAEIWQMFTLSMKHFMINCKL